MTKGSEATEAAGPYPPGLRPTPYRWAVLAAFMGTSIAAQMLWLTFAALPPCSTPALCPTPDNATWLTLSYPLVFVIVSLPVGYLIDARGFRLAVLIGSALLAVSGILRPFAPTFPVMLAFQAIGALGQPFVLNSVSKVVRAWFPEPEVATATGLGTLSIYLGLALGFGLTPVLGSMIGALALFEVYGACAAVAFVLFLLIARERPGAPVEERPASPWDAFRLLRIRNIALLSALFFVGIGIFNAFAAEVQPMLGARGIDPTTAGLLGSALIVGGIVGAVGMSYIADRYRTLRKPLILALVASTVLWAVLGFVQGVLAEAVGLAVLGFFFMSTLPLALELSARSVGRAQEGAANAVVWEFSQAGGFILVLLFVGVAASVGWGSSFFLAAGLTAIMLALGALLKTA